MRGFDRQFSRVKGVSQKRRLPRLGKIRLGVKKVSKKSGAEYPAEVDYFVVPKEVQAIYGEQPKCLDIMFPINSIDAVFATAYKYYGKSKGLKCIGDGEVARRLMDDGSFREVECPCEKSKEHPDEETGKMKRASCSIRATLFVILPEVNLGGVYQLDVGSYHSIVDIQSGIDYCRGLVHARTGKDTFAGLKMLLKREPRETHHAGAKQTHYTLRVFSNFTLAELDRLMGNASFLHPPDLALPPAEETNPAQDPGATVVYTDEEDQPEPETPSQPTGEATTEEQPPANDKPLPPGVKRAGAIADDVLDKAKAQSVIQDETYWTGEYDKRRKVLEKMVMEKKMPARTYSNVIAECCDMPTFQARCDLCDNVIKKYFSGPPKEKTDEQSSD